MTSDPSRRTTRSLARTTSSQDPIPTTPPILPHPAISLLPPSTSLTTTSTSLRRKDLTLLLKKQRLLRTSTSSTLPSLPSHFQTCLSSTLVFAQQEAGTAVCISSTGLLLTCSHCVSEDEEDLEENRLKWLLFASGRLVRARCTVYDQKRDLALLQIISAEPAPSHPVSRIDTGQETNWTSFPFIPISPTPPKKNTELICIGHPGDEDLESTTPGRKTGYDVLHTSFGRYRGVAEGADVQDNSEIGALMHDCWTYWGHSGAPLCLKKDGRLVGCHSSWDYETGMRRGVAWEAIVAFLRENGELRGGVGTVESPILVD